MIIQSTKKKNKTMNWSKEEIETNIKAAQKLSTNTFKIPNHFSFYKNKLYFLTNFNGTNTLCKFYFFYF